jgi:hypothetical protein
MISFSCRIKFTIDLRQLVVIPDRPLLLVTQMSVASSFYPLAASWYVPRQG